VDRIVGDTDQRSSILLVDSQHADPAVDCSVGIHSQTGFAIENRAPVDIRLRESPADPEAGGDKLPPGLGDPFDELPLIHAHISRVQRHLETFRQEQERNFLFAGLRRGVGVGRRPPERQWVDPITAIEQLRDTVVLNGREDAYVA
jgi:hypothetical protein